MQIADEVRTGEQLKAIVVQALRKRTEGVPQITMRVWDDKTGAGWVRSSDHTVYHVEGGVGERKRLPAGASGVGVPAGSLDEVRYNASFKACDAPRDACTCQSVMRSTQ